jgi:predicted amidohydrolase YtcJ
MIGQSESGQARGAILGGLLAALAALGEPAMAQAPASGGQADVIFVNGRIATLDRRDSVASAVAVRNEKFLAVGSNAQILRLAGPKTLRIDLEGKTVVPGLIDGHAHPMETIYLKEDWVDARFPGTASVKQALENIAARVKTTPKGEWIFVACVSASQNKFAEKRVPTKAELDAVAPDNPVVLANGTHMAVANSMALQRLGVKKGTTKLPNGGTVLLDDAQEPTGVLTDAQADVPANPTASEMERYYVSGIQQFWNRYGFTSVMAITPSAALPVLKKVAQGPAKPTLRYTLSIWTSANAQNMPVNVADFEMPPGTNPAYHRFAALKDWVDGENDCRTGYMYENYLGHFDTDPPGDRGTLVTPQTGVDRFVGIAGKSRKIAMLHCSGDAATDIALDTYEKSARTGASKAGISLPIKRIEHFGMFQLSERQLARAKALKPRGLAVSVQPAWLLGLARANVENMGQKLALTGFRFRTMIAAGLEPAAGTDMTGIYLENIDPMKAIWASVTRASDAGPFAPSEAVSVKDALRMWTIWAARAMGEGNLKGSIEPGKYADMTVLSDDIFSIVPDKLQNVRTVKTIVGGRVVYEITK